MPNNHRSLESYAYPQGSWGVIELLDRYAARQRAVELAGQYAARATTEVEQVHADRLVSTMQDIVGEFEAENSGRLLPRQP